VSWRDGENDRAWEARETQRDEARERIAAFRKERSEQRLEWYRTQLGNRSGGGYITADELWDFAKLARQRPGATANDADIALKLEDFDLERTRVQYRSTDIWSMVIERYFRDDGQSTYYEDGDAPIGPARAA
jgi:hypothetical protein